MDYNRLINNWHTRAGEEDYFSKFVFEYLAFIAFIKTQKYPGENNQKTVRDRDAIQMLKRDTSVRTAYLERVLSNQRLKKAWETIKTELDKAPLGDVSKNTEYAKEIKWWNCSHANLDEKTHEEKRERSGIIHCISDWENMVEFWYGIRNNLFHGGKDPEASRDQFAVEYGYWTLRELVALLLNE